MEVNKHSNQYVILRNYSPETLQNVLDGFIKLFVLCKTCENPETDLVSGTRHRANSILFVFF